MADYGLLSAIRQCCRRQHTLHDTFIYTAPEVFEGKEELKSDVWSLGVTLMELAERVNPFFGMSTMKLVMRVMKEEPPTLSLNKWSSDFVDFVKQCMTKDVERRPCVNDLMNVGANEWSDG